MDYTGDGSDDSHHENQTGGRQASCGQHLLDLVNGRRAGDLGVRVHSRLGFLFRGAGRP